MGRYCLLCPNDPRNTRCQCIYSHQKHKTGSPVGRTNHTRRTFSTTLHMSCTSHTAMRYDLFCNRQQRNHGTKFLHRENGSPHHLRDLRKTHLAFITWGEIPFAWHALVQEMTPDGTPAVVWAAVTNIRRILGEHVLSDVHEIVDGSRLSTRDWTAGTQLNALPICTALHIKRCTSRCFSIHPCSYRHTHTQIPLRGRTHPPERGCGSNWVAYKKLVCTSSFRKKCRWPSV